MYNPDFHQLVFISGLHRSGTSLFFKILKAQKNMSGFENTGVAEDEGQLLQSVYPAAQVFGGPGKFGFDKRAHLTEKSPLISPENQKKILEEWKPYWDFNKKILLEKSPPNLLKTRFLQKLFPHSKFITTTRHPLAVSFATQKWCNTTIYKLVKHWVHCHKIFEQDKPHLERHYQFKYEDFTENPEKILGEVGVFFNEKLILSENFKVKNTVNQKYFEEWERYKKHFFKGILARRIIKDFEEDINEFGYSFLM